MADPHQENFIEAMEKNLSEKSYQALRRANVCSADDLLAFKSVKLRGLWSLGEACIFEILSFIESFTEGEASDNPHADDEVTRQVLATTLFYNTAKRKIIDFLTGTAYGAEQAEIESLFPADTIESGVLPLILGEMESDGQITIETKGPFAGKIDVRKMTVLEYMQSLAENSTSKILLERLRGINPFEISRWHGISVQNVYEITEKCLSKRPALSEDKYKEVFMKNNLSLDEFTTLFCVDNPVYYYLTLVCHKRNASPIRKTQKTIPKTNVVRNFTFMGPSSSKDSEPEALFRDAEGILLKDIPISKLGLTPCKLLALQNAGYVFASQLIGVSTNTLASIRGIGMKSAYVISGCIKKHRFEQVHGHLFTYGENADCMALVNAIKHTLPVHGGTLYQELIPIYKRAEEEGRNIGTAEAFAAASLRFAVKRRILDFLSCTEYGAELFEIEALFSGDIAESGVIPIILNEMESDCQITVDGKIDIKKLTVFEYVESIQNNNIREVMLSRLRGLTAAEISKQRNVSRQCVYEVIGRCLLKRPALIEDKYRKAYETYDLSKEEFIAIFGVDDAVYTYLTLVCKKRGALPIERMTCDGSLSIGVRQTAEEIVQGNRIPVDGGYISKNKGAIVDYLLRTYFMEPGSIDDFTARYETFLNDCGLQGDNRLLYSSQGLMNKLLFHKNTLWAWGQRFRYYDYDCRDFTELCKAITQYRDMEYSTHIIYGHHPKLMRMYDVRDKYELHNLLRKLCKRGIIKNVRFGKMPVVAFGDANRDRQVRALLAKLYPISRYRLAAAYREEYGIEISLYPKDYHKILYRNFVKDLPFT